MIDERNREDPFHVVKKIKGEKKVTKINRGRERERG